MGLASALSQLYRKPGLKTTIIIEEGFVCGRLEILEMAYVTGRKLGIEIVIVFQSVSQIKQLYARPMENLSQWRGALLSPWRKRHGGLDGRTGWPGIGARAERVRTIRPQ